MAITSKNLRTGETTVSYAGRVVRVSRFTAKRNHSDTLDYSDWQETECVNALVYFGHTAERSMWLGNVHYDAGDEIPVLSRFGHVDCTNLFVWRGANEETAEADVDFDSTDPEMLSLIADYHAWERAKEAEAFAAREAAKQRVAEEEARHEKNRVRLEAAERNRPKVGKRVRITNGPNKGMLGTVAYVSGRGSALVKPDSAWRDRKVDGVWAGPKWLEAR